MANNTEQLSLKLALESGNFSQKISAINKSIKNLDRDFKSAGNGVNGFENTLVGLNSKVQKSANQIELYNKKLENQKKEYDKLNTALERQNNKLNELENTLGKNSNEYKNQQQLIQQTASKMSTLGSQITQTQGNLNRLGNELNQATREMEQLNNRSMTVDQRLASVGRQATLAESQFNRLQSELSGTGNFIQRLGNDMERLSSQIQQNISKINIYENELNKLGSESQQLSARQLQLATSIQETEDELLQISNLYGRTSTEAQQLSTRLLGLRDDFNRNEQEIEQNSNALNRYQSELNETQARVNRLGNELRQMPFDRIGNALRNTGSNLKSAGMDMFQYVTLPLTLAGGASAKAAIDIESAFAGVKKTMDTTGLTAEETDARFETLTNGIMELSKRMPTSAVEIAAVAEAAGQLGIKSDAILGFTETMVMLGDTTNLSADEAATALARLANITGMPQSNFDKLGSTIVALGNNLATTEAEITAMGLRLAGAGSQVGMSEAEIMSFSAALSSVGIEAEAGGSAFSKVMIEMQLASEKGGDSLDNFAKVAGMSSSEFSKAFKDDAPQAIMAFIEGLGTAEERGLSAIGILDDMGISEVRLRDTLLRASGASDVFSEALQIGSKAWEENNALTKEAELRYETTASKLKIAKNRLIETGKAIGEHLIPVIVDVVDAIAEWASEFNELDDSQQKTILKMAGFAAAIGPVLIGLGSIMMVGGNAVLVFGAMSSAFSGAASGTGIISKALGLLSKSAIPGAILAVLGLISIVGESENALDYLGDKFGILGVIIGGVCEGIAGGTQLTFGNLVILVKGAAEAIGAIVAGEFWKVDDIVSKTWANVENNTAKALSNIAGESTSALNLLETKTKEQLSSVEKIFELSLTQLPKLTNDNIREVAKVFSDNLSNLDKDSLTILRGTSDNMAMLFEGISEGMDNEIATKQFIANLESMNKTGQLDGLEEDISNAMDLINRNVSDGTIQMKQSSTDMFNAFKSSAQMGMEGAVSNVVGQLGNMNQETLSQLTSMGTTWEQAFEGIKLDGSMSSEQMKQSVLDNIESMGIDSETLISNLRKESSEHWKTIANEATKAGNTVATSFDQVPKEIVTEFKNNGIESEKDVLNLYNLYNQLPTEIQTYIKANGYEALKGAEDVNEVLNNIPIEKRIDLLTSMQNEGNITPEQLQLILDTLPKDEKVKIETDVKGEDKIDKVKKDVETIPNEKTSKVKVETGDSSTKVDKVKKDVESLPTEKTTKVNSETSTASQNVTGYKKNLDDFDKKHTSKTKETKFKSDTATASKGVTGLKTNISDFVSKYCKSFTTTFNVVTKYKSQGTPTSQSSDIKVPKVQSIPQIQYPQTRESAFSRDMSDLAQPQVSPILQAQASIMSASYSNKSHIAIGGADIANSLKYDIDLLTELNNKIKIVENSLSSLDVKFDDAIGSEKINYLKEQNKLYDEQIKLHKDLEDKLIKQKNYYQYSLKGKGFTFDLDEITNYEEKLISLEKEVSNLEYTANNANEKTKDSAQKKYDSAKKNLEDIKKLLSEYLSVTLSELPKAQDEWNKLNNEIQNNNKEINKLKQEMWALNIESTWTSIYRDVQEVNNELELLEVNMKNAFGDEKLDMMDQQIELLEKYKKELGETTLYLESVKNQLADKLRGYGFDVRDNGTIGNYIQQLNKLKETSDNFEDAERVAKEYLDLLINKIPDANKELAELDNKIKDVYKEQLNIVSNMEKQITDIYKKQLDERKKLIEEELKKRVDALNKEQDAYNKSRDKVNYKRDYDDQLEKVNKLNKQLAIAKRDTSLSGQKKVQDLLEKLEDENDRLQEIVQSKIDKDVNDMFDNEESRLEDSAQDYINSLEDKFSDSKIQQLIKDALGSGTFKDIDGNIHDLEDTMLEFTDKFGQGLSITGDLIKTELIGNLDLAMDAFKNLSNIMDELDISKFKTNVDYSSQRYNPPSSNNNTTNNNTRNVTIQMNTPLINIQGSVDKNVMLELEKLSRSIIKQAGQEITKKIVDKYKF